MSSNSVGCLVQAGLLLLMMLSTSWVGAGSSSLASSGFGNVSVFVPNLIGTGMNLLYLLNKPLILLSSRKSFSSSLMCRIISVPRVVLSDASSVKEGDPSQVQCAAGSSLKDLVIISTLSATIKAE